MLLRRALLLALAASSALGGCVSPDNAAKVETALGKKCTLDSDCSAPNVCVFELCHAECATDADCEGGGRCVKGEGASASVCQLLTEVSCSKDVDCPGQQICAKDGECRDACSDAMDCVSPQTCVAGACASADELVDGGLPATGGEGKECHWNSDCPGVLLCINGVCGPECKGAKDCEQGAVCVEGACVIAPYCGDGVVDPGEACDGTAGLQLCDDGVTPAPCGADCTFDLAGCPAFCGDGNVDPGEDCDGSTAGLSCPNGLPPSCSAACQKVCPDLCGDSLKGASEECDGPDLGGDTCLDHGFLAGMLACAADCKFIFKMCLEGCGNGILEGPEKCDGGDFGGATCANVVPGTTGPLLCSADCTAVDTSLCVVACGNGALDPGEDCDGMNLGSLTCQSFGFAGGSLACTPNCTYDTSGCS